MNSRCFFVVFLVIWYSILANIWNVKNSIFMLPWCFVHHTSFWRISFEIFFWNGIYSLAPISVCSISLFSASLCLSRYHWWLFLSHFYHVTLNISLNYRNRVWSLNAKYFPRINLIFFVRNFKLLSFPFSSFSFVRDEVFESNRSKTFLIKIIIKREIIWKLFVWWNPHLI